MQFLIDLFNELNYNNIGYFVIGDYFELPNYTGNTDIDIFIEEEDLPLTISLLNTSINLHNGLIASYYKTDNSYHFRIISKNDPWWGTQIDLLFRGFKYYNQYFPLDFLKQNIILHNGIKVCNFQVGYLLGFLKVLLFTSSVKSKYLNVAKKYYLNNIAIIEPALNKIYNDNFLLLLSEYFKNQDSVHFRVLRKNAKKSLTKNFFREVLYKIMSIKELTRLKKKPGFSIVFMGTDGSGKSTIINLIKPILLKPFHKAVYYEHLRPNYIHSLSRLSGKNVSNVPITNPHESSTSGFLGSLFRFGYYYIDYTIGYLLKIFPKIALRSCIWIFDRYYYDYYIDQRRSRIRLPRWIIRLGQVFIPEPDLIICLGADPAIIHARKPELPLAEVERQTLALKKFASTHKLAVWVDTGIAIEDSSNAVLHHIIKVMSKRFEKIKI